MEWTMAFITATVHRYCEHIGIYSKLFNIE